MVPYQNLQSAGEVALTGNVQKEKKRKCKINKHRFNLENHKIKEKKKNETMEQTQEVWQQENTEDFS